MNSLALNRRAQVGKFITGFVVFIFIVVIIGIFLALTLAIANLKGATQKDGHQFLEPGFALHKQVGMLNNGDASYLLALDEWISVYMGKKSYGDISGELKGLVDENRKCFFGFDEYISLDEQKGNGIINGVAQVFKGKVRNFFLMGGMRIEFKNGKAESMNEGREIMNDAFYKGKFSMAILTLPVKEEVKSVHISYYLGPCASEAGK